MPTNDFLPFGLGVDANVLEAVDWASDSERLMGFRQGLAKSIKANTAWKHTSFVTAALAFLVMETLGEDVRDNGDLPFFIGQLRRAMIEVTGGPDAPDDGRRYVRMYRHWVLGDDWFLPLDGGVMRGFITLHAPPAMDMNPVNLGFLRERLDEVLSFLRGNYLPLAGTDHPDVVPPQMRGFITLHAHPVLDFHAATKWYVDDSIANLRNYLDGNFLPLVGGTMQGFITLHADPVNPMHAATKRYVDNELARNLERYLPLIGGTLYRPGGSNILLMHADPDQWAGIRYNVHGVRLWAQGVASPSGAWYLHDETDGAFRHIVNPGHVGAAATEFWSRGHSVSLALYGHSWEHDNYIRMVGANDWLFGPQAGRGRFLFYNGADRFAIYDDGTISCGWDAYVPATVWTAYVDAREQTTTQRLWVWNVAEVNGLRVTGFFPGDPDGLIVHQRAAFGDGIFVWNGSLTVANSLVSNTWGGVQVHGGLAVIASDAWFNSWTVTIDRDLVVGHAIVVAPPPIAETPLMCGAVSAPYLLATRFVESWGYIRAATDVLVGNQVSTQHLWVANYGRIANLDIDNWISGFGGGVLNIVGASCLVHGHLSAMNSQCVFGQFLAVSGSMAAQVDGDTLISRNLIVNGIVVQCAERFKANIMPVSRDALDALRKVQFFEYDTLYEGGGGSHETTGIVADQIAEALPEAVDESTLSTRIDESAGSGFCGPIATQPYRTVRLMPLMTYSMRAIQQLADRNDALEARIAELERRA